ncbi:hypothetical protein Taro_015429 [Colocasia esculenta]|uniref:Uncharacterized protein n=1 Tax=Colocasia esculenta TaxID=4460 RepID=A0A843UL83_COLES|nr:hypothetical protein [Colocasia esculenta]
MVYSIGEVVKANVGNVFGGIDGWSLQHGGTILHVYVLIFQNFFNWLMRCIKLPEPAALVSLPNSELVITFLKFHYNRDPISQLLEASEMHHDVEVDL